jgi:ACT domain-containing protein
MMMIIDVYGNQHLNKLRDELNLIGEEMDLKINIQLEEIFQAMHRI